MCTFKNIDSKNEIKEANNYVVNKYRLIDDSLIKLYLNAIDNNDKEKIIIL